MAAGTRSASVENGSRTTSQDHSNSVRDSAAMAASAEGAASQIRWLRVSARLRAHVARARLPPRHSFAHVPAAG